MDNEQLLEKALDEIPLRERTDIAKGEMEAFLKLLSKKFLEERIKDFKNLCSHTRKVNIQYMKTLEEIGNKSPTRMIGGKMVEGTFGWSADGEFKHQWIIPMQLKFFMRNCVYAGFWDKDNERIKNAFLRSVMKGEDPYELLMKLRLYYGTNDKTIS